MKKEKEYSYLTKGHWRVSNCVNGFKELITDKDCIATMYTDSEIEQRVLANSKRMYLLLDKMSGMPEEMVDAFFDEIEDLLKEIEGIDDRRKRVL